MVAITRAAARWEPHLVLSCLIETEATCTQTALIWDMVVGGCLYVANSSSLDSPYMLYCTTYDDDILRVHVPDSSLRHGYKIYWPLFCHTYLLLLLTSISLTYIVIYLPFYIITG
jgi:hypothetical protein